VRRLALLPALAAVCFLTLRIITAQPVECPDCRLARLWSTTAAEFPESQDLRMRRPGAIDLGIAFSGGGTRSASATTGQLRGLAQNGWIEKVRYITAVSGGSWAAIPYTYTEASDAELLGPLVPPEKLEYEAVTRCPDGRMAAYLGASGLPAASFKEALWRGSAAKLSNESEKFLRKGLTWLLSRREGERGEKTYSRFIGDVFVDPIIDPVGKQASRRLFAWDSEAIDSVIHDNPGQFSHIQFLTTDSSQRPFLIVGGTVASTREVYSYPLLMPIEYTPLYTGIRHRFGEKFGGVYVSSWAYDHLPEGQSDGKSLTVHQGVGDRKFTIADVAAASGSAPQLAVLLGEHYPALPGWAQNASGAAAGFFPSFTHVTVQKDGGVTASGPVPHGDGGFTDNFGLMPLLARGVKNIIVFANVNGEYDQNDDLASYFESVPDPGPTGNKTLNRVFDENGYDMMTRQFRADRIAHRPLVYCGTGWKVLRNEIYEIKPYTGLNICWVYIHAVDDWTVRVQDKRLRELLADKKFKSFPWYDTFKELKLNTPHVNLLADLTSWVMTDPEVVKRIRAAIPDLPDPIAPAQPQPIQFIDGSCVAPGAAPRRVN
jgi:patatin-like phospholipase